MKVSELLAEINRNISDIGEDFLNYDVYTEQCMEGDKNHKRAVGWETFIDPDEWEYFKCIGFWTINKNNKAFTINVNY